MFNLGKNTLSRNIRNIDFSTLFYQYIVTTFKLHSIVKYYLLFFIVNIVFTFNKKTKLAFGKLVS